MTVLEVEEEGYAYVGGGLAKETNWWGAFVVGLAGTILVLGVTPPVLAGLGSSALPNFLFWTLTGWLLCMFLAEMAAMLPERTGGAPAYAYFAFKERLPRLVPHVNGVTAWMYWLGWFPVTAVNMLLTGAYLPVLLGFSDRTPTVHLVGDGTPVSLFTIAVGIVLSFVLLAIALMGIRFGTRAATVLGILTLVPLTLMTILPFLRPSTIVLGNVFPFRLPDGGSAITGAAFFLYLQFSALFTWNVIAMEAAACYIGECRNPHRDAPIAMNLEGGYGAFIYTVLPFSVLAVLGVGAIKADPLALLAGFAGRVIQVPVVARLVTLMLLVALALSSLNAIMGCARSLHQMSLDGQAPRILSHRNHNDVPDAAMTFNVVLTVALIFLGAPATIYIFSNVGYVGSFVPVLLGYYFLRRWHPELRRPYRLPEWMKYLALLLAALYFVVWSVGIPACAIKGCVAGGGLAYLLGLGVVAAYFPLKLAAHRRRPQGRTAHGRGRACGGHGGCRDRSGRPGGAGANEPRRRSEALDGGAEHGGILLASAAGGFPRAAVERAAELAAAGDHPVMVLSVARIWGTALGVPHPGLYPSRRELGEHRDAVRVAAGALHDRGIPVALQVVSTRNPGRAIARCAERAGSHAVVVVERAGRRWARRWCPSTDITRRTGLTVESVAASARAVARSGEVSGPTCRGSSAR